MKHREPTSDVGISFVYEPEELRSVLVRLDRNLFFFPDYERSSDFYERLDGLPAVGQRLTMFGMSLDLPRRPQFAFDYHPMRRLATFPPAERAPKPGGEEAGRNWTAR